jgi:Uma2 family endonuclease
MERVPEGSRVEVIDGALIVNPSPLPLHQRIVRRLADALERWLPRAWQLDIDVDVMLAEDPLDYVAPDIVVFDTRVPLTTRPIHGKDVLLVVEVVSKGSKREDRAAKPLVYADAGIAHLWRVETPETGASRITVHTFDLVAGNYVQTGEHSGRLTLPIPFPVDVELSRLDR